MYGEPSLNFIEQECPYVLSDGTAPRATGQTLIHSVCDSELGTFLCACIVQCFACIEHLHAAKVGGPGSDPRWLPWFFFSFTWLINVDEMKDLWCSSTVWLLSTQMWVNVKTTSMLG